MGFTLNKIQPDILRTSDWHVNKQLHKFTITAASAGRKFSTLIQNRCPLKKTAFTRLDVPDVHEETSPEAHCTVVPFNSVFETSPSTMKYS